MIKDAFYLLAICQLASFIHCGCFITKSETLGEALQCQNVTLQEINYFIPYITDSYGNYKDSSFKRFIIENSDLSDLYTPNKMHELSYESIYLINCNITSNNQIILERNIGDVVIVIYGNNIKSLGNIIVPYDDQVTFVTCNFSNNNIETVNSLCSGSSNKIYDLILSRNKIRSIQYNSLDKCRKYIKSFDVSHNKLSFLNHTLAEFSQIQKLNLSYNTIQEITNDNIFNLDLLVALDLSHNSIKILTSYTFVKTINLEVLKLNDNNINIIEAYAFHGLFLLRELDLNRNNMKTIGAIIFNQVCNLNQLLLESNPVSDIEENAFRGLENVREMRFDYMFLKNIKNKTFSGLKNIMLLTFINVTSDNLLRSVNEGNLKMLKHLKISITNLYTIYTNQLRNLVNLETLSITNAKLQYLEPDSLNLSKLQMLILAKNNLSTLPCHIVNSSLSFLTFLDLSQNNIDYLSDCTFTNFPNLTHLQLNNNRITKITSQVLSPLSKLQYLDLSNNYLNTFDGDAYKKIKALIPLISLIDLELSNNNFMRLSMDEFQFNQNLKYIGLANNKFTCPILVEVLLALSSRNVNYIPRIGGNYTTFNLNGITCKNIEHEKFITT